jgi:UDP-glucuronate decarboxylase
MHSEKDFSGFHVLLTGGTGFFGRALLRHWQSLEQNGEKIAQVCVLSRNPDSFLKQYPEFSGHSWLHFHQGDILSTSSLPRDEFTHLLHAATDSTLGPKLTPLDRYIQIVDGTRNMLEYAVANQIPKFLLTSSGGVYGQQPQEFISIPEEYNGMPDPLRSENAYSVSKRTAEHLCTLYRDRYGLNIIIARCFTFVGRDLPLNAHFAIGNFIKDAVCGREIIIKGDGSPVRTYMDQRDLAHWLTTLMYEGLNGEAYNIGSDVQVTIQELAELVRDTIAPQLLVRITNQYNKKNLINRYIPNISKAQQQLKLELKYSLQQAVIDAARGVV